jgi:hypothetical protein
VIQPARQMMGALFLLLVLPAMFPEGAWGLEVFTNHFLVHMNAPGADSAHRVAKRNGFVNRGPVSDEDGIIICKLLLEYYHPIFALARCSDRTRNGTSCNPPSLTPEPGVQSAITRNWLGIRM